MLAALVVLVAGCNGGQKNGSGEKTAAPRSSDLTLARVVDEADALAWAGQVEGEALDLLLNKKVGVGAKYAFPNLEQLTRTPAKFRGKTAQFSGKLVTFEKLSFKGEAARLGKLYRGVVLRAEGKLIAFICRAEREPTKEAVGAGMKIPVAVPPKGSAVMVRGFFLKRWAAMDAAGRDYVVVPLIASGAPVALTGTDADALKKLEPPAGKLPLKPIEAPEVWKRPVIQVKANGRLLLDGKHINWDELLQKIYPRAAKHRNPLGDSALAIVILCAPEAPKSVRDRARKFPGTQGARCIFRTLK